MCFKLGLPLALLATVVSSVCFALQAALYPPPTQHFSITLVDLLSNDTDYTSLLRLLQRARLIPTLNRLNGTTFFAPTNDAIERRARTNSLWRVHDADTLSDNVREQLRQQLYYHLLNYSITLSFEGEHKVRVEQTLLFPSPPVPPSQESLSSLPWMPIPGGTLGGEPQRLRLTKREGEVYVGVDAFGRGKVQIVKPQKNAGNGVLFGISEVLDPPPNLAPLVAQQSSVSYFHKILTPSVTERLNMTSELTLFLPINSAWDTLDDYERLYLESDYATDDLTRLFNMHAVVEKHVRYSQSFKPALKLTTIDGTELEVVVTAEKTTVAGVKLIEPDIYASNGVLHLIDSLLVPPGALQLTPEKYLLALNCSKFVSMLHSVDLAGLVNNTEAQYTILAPRDDILTLVGGEGLPDRGSDELRKLLKYHFIPGRWKPAKLRDGLLLETVLREEGLGGGRQVLDVAVTTDTGSKTTDRSIQFGGAGVIGDSIGVNNTLIYFVSRPLVPPADPLQTALPYLQFSSFLAAIFSTSQAEALRSTPRTSLLIPHNEAFKRLGLLVSAHLLAPSSKQDLENVLLHHAVDGVEYSGSFQNGSQQSFATLETSDLKVDRLKNGTVYVSASGGWAGMKAEIYLQDTLTKTGVIHELSDILIPRSVELTIGKLMKAAKGSTMATLMTKSGFDWILNGSSPPEGSPWLDEGLGGAGWTLLCPTDDAFKEYNLTKLYDDVEGLRTIVTQHLIPTPLSSRSTSDSDALNNNRPLDMDGSAKYSTLRSPSSAYGDIVFMQQNEDNEYVVGIKGARGTDGKGDWARVLAWGRSTTGGGTGGVIQIDRLLIPYEPAWWYKYGAPSSVGALGVGVICLFFYGVRVLWKRDTTEATYEPVGGFGRDDL